MTGIELIALEREAQIKSLGFSVENDAKRPFGELLQLAIYCIFSNNDNLPKHGFSGDYIKQLHYKSRIEQLAIAGALIAAEMDVRILEIENKEKESKE